MFDRSELTKVIDLQRRSYSLLLWVNHAFFEGKLSLSRLHGSMSMQAAAADWIASIQSSLPTDARVPDPADLPRFASIFVSYLNSSFEPTSAPVRISRNGCMCELCSTLAAPTRLRPRQVTPKAIAVAHRLKIIALRTLAEERSLPLLEVELDALTHRADFPSADLVWLAYGVELLRRSAFASQGDGVHSLWRQLVYHEEQAGRHKVELAADRFLAAEEALAAYLRAEVDAA